MLFYGIDTIIKLPSFLVHRQGFFRKLLSHTHIFKNHFLISLLSNFMKYLSCDFFFSHAPVRYTHIFQIKTSKWFYDPIMFVLQCAIGFFFARACWWTQCHKLCRNFFYDSRLLSLCLSNQFKIYVLKDSLWIFLCLFYIFLCTRLINQLFLLYVSIFHNE